MRLAMGYTFALLLTFSILIGAFMMQSKAEDQSENCPSHTVFVENASTKVIQVDAIRWLETLQEKWITFDIPQSPIEVGASRSWDVELRGLKCHDTFLDIEYRILEDAAVGTWSHIRKTSQRHVPSCIDTTMTRIKVVDLR